MEPNPKAIRQTIEQAIPAESRDSSVVYMDPQPYEEGDTLNINRHEYTVPKRQFLYFIDLQAGKNWGHNCVYVLVDADTAQVEKIPGRFPPRLPSDRSLTMIYAGRRVPEYAKAEG